MTAYSPFPATTETLVTPQMFDALVEQPGYFERNLELLNGRIIEKVASHPWSSHLGGIFVTELNSHIRGKKLGRVTGADGGYHVGENRFMSDCAFLRAENATAPIVSGYRSGAPDIAVEVLSPTDKKQAAADKIAAYRVAGVLLWLVNPEQQTITVYDGMEPEFVLTLADTLTGGRVLPGFRADLADLFADEMA